MFGQWIAWENCSRHSDDLPERRQYWNQAIGSVVQMNTVNDPVLLYNWSWFFWLKAAKNVCCPIQPLGLLRVLSDCKPPLCWSGQAQTIHYWVDAGKSWTWTSGVLWLLDYYIGFLCVLCSFYLLLARKETSELFLRAGFDSKYYYITCNLYCRCWFRMCAEFLCRKTPTRSRATWIDAVLSVVGLGLLLGVRMERSNTEDNFFQIKQSSCLWTRSYCWTRPDNERI